MASLIDCLIEDLTNENDGYEKLLSLSNEKTSAIVSGNIEKLQEIFAREQKLIEEVDVYEKKRQEDVKDICNVLRLPYEEIKVEHIVQILEKKAKEHDEDFYDGWDGTKAYRYTDTQEMTAPSEVTFTTVTGITYTPATYETVEAEWKPTLCNEKPVYDPSVVHQVGDKDGCWTWKEIKAFDMVSIPPLAIAK